VYWIESASEIAPKNRIRQNQRKSSPQKIAQNQGPFPMPISKDKVKG
jgi:hypothetical protein